QSRGMRWPTDDHRPGAPPAGARESRSRHPLQPRPAQDEARVHDRGLDREGRVARGARLHPPYPRRPRALMTPALRMVALALLLGGCAVPSWVPLIGKPKGPPPPAPVAGKPLSP